MSINVTDLGKALVDHVGFGNEGNFPDRFLSIKVTGEGTFGRNAGDTFGASVAVQGDYAIVGVPAQDYDADGNNVVTEAGAAYVFTRNISTWEFVTKLTPSVRNANDTFGTSVAIYEDRLAVGAPGIDGAEGANTGAVFIYEFQGEWVETAILRPSETIVIQSAFGTSLTMAGDFLVSGAPVNNTNDVNTQPIANAGAAWVFYRDPDTDVWSQVQKIHAFGNDRNAGDLMGTSTSGSLTSLAVGVPGHSYSGRGQNYLAGAGAVLMFDWNSTTQAWDYQGKLTPATRAAGDAFGTKVELNGKVLAVYSPTDGSGNVTVFERNDDGVWLQTAAFAPTGTTTGAKFGSALSATADTIVIGAPNEGTNAANSGAVYVYRKTNGAWALEKKQFTPEGAIASALFGFSVSAIDNQMLIGSPGMTLDDSGADPRTAAGAAYLFSRDGSNVWSLKQKISADGHDRNADDALGAGIVVNDDTLFVGAAGHDYDSDGKNFVAGAGAIYIWNLDAGAWKFAQKLTPTGVNARGIGDAFGAVMALEGDTLVVGVPSHSYDALGGSQFTGSGAVFTFTRVNGVWVQEAKIVSGNRGSGLNFGRAVDLQGDVLVASALDTVSTQANAGVVYAFTRAAGTGVWSQEAIVQAPVADVQAQDKFGDSVSIREGLLLVGSIAHTLDFDGLNPQTNAGAAWLFTRDDGAYNFQTKFTGWGQDRNANDNLGFSISSSGDTLVVGAPHHSYDADSRNFVDRSGAAYVYIWANSSWNFQQKITAQSGQRAKLARFGWSVAVSGDQLVIGAPGDNTDLTNNTNVDTLSPTSFGPGRVYVFTRTFGKWDQTTRLIPSGTNAHYDNLAMINPPLDRNYVLNQLTYLSQARFGWSVAIKGDEMIVGQPWSVWDAQGTNRVDFAGAAYIFERNASNNTWAQTARLVSSNRTNSDNFGLTVDIRDGIAIVGSPYDDYDHEGNNQKQDSGAAFVFRKQLDGQGGFIWTQEQKLVGWGQERNVGDLLGYSVSGDGGTLVVGSPGHPYRDDGNQYRAGAGAVYVWIWNGSGWTFQQKLSASGTNARQAGDMFGQAVAISGDTIVVGSPYYDYTQSGAAILGTNTGSAWIYGRTNGVWALQQKVVLPATSVITAQNSEVTFGYSVAVKGNTVAIGAPGFRLDSTNANPLANAGGVWIYKKTGTTWAMEQQLLSPHRAQGELFGQTVALADDMIVIGAPGNDTEQNGTATTLTDFGAVYIFRRAGSVWSYIQKITGPGNDRNPTDNFGYSMSYKNGLLVVGAPQHDYDEAGEEYTIDAGSAYIWSWTGSAWNFEQKVTAQGLNSRTTNDRFGHSVSTDGSVVVVGAPGQDYDASGANLLAGAGAAFVYRKVAGTWTQEARLVPTGTNARVAGDSFGWSVAVDGDNMIIGSPNHDFDATGTNQAIDAGAAFVFKYATGAWTQTQKLVGFGNNGRLAGDTFGYSVSVDFIWLVVGAPAHDYDESGADLQANAGAIWIYSLDDDGVWQPHQKMVGWGRDRQTGDASGSAMAASGIYLAVGAPGQDYDASYDLVTDIVTPTNYTTDAGAVYIWKWNGTSWTIEQKIVPSIRTTGASFGTSVALEGDLLVVGAPIASSPTGELLNYGNAVAFRRTGADPVRPWAEEHIFEAASTAIAPYAGLGTNVAINNGEVLVSSPGDNRTGAVQFTGASWLKYGDSPDLTFGFGDFTFETWVNLNALGPGNQGVMSSYSYVQWQGTESINNSTPREWGLFINSAGRPFFSLSSSRRYEDARITSTASITPLTWNHIAVTRASGIVTLWVNGVATGSGNYPYNVAPATRGLSLGQVLDWGGDANSSSQRYLNGTLDGTRVSKGLARYTGAFTPPSQPSDFALDANTSFLLMAENVLPSWQDSTGKLSVSWNQLRRGPSYFNYGIKTGAGGQVLAFTKTGGNWNLTQTILPTGTNAAMSGDRFGASLASVDDLLVVGAPGQDYDVDGNNQLADAGAVFLYRKVAGQWTQVQKMIGWGHDSAANDQFGYSMSGSGMTLAVGAPNHAYNDVGSGYHANGGAVYIWKWSGNPAAWSLEQKITADDAQDNANFGWSVSVDDDRLIVGAPNHTTNSVASGAAYIFNRVAGAAGTRVWTQAAKIVPTGTNAANAGDKFGYTVSIQQTSNTAIIGAPYHQYDAAGANQLTDAGAVWSYIFTASAWTLKDKIVAGSMNKGLAGDVGRQAGDNFGWSVDVRDNVLIIGSPNHDYDQTGRNPQTDAGAAYVYSRSAQANSWTQVQKLVGWGQERNVGDHFGYAVAGDGLTLAVGAPDHSYDANGDFYVLNAGAVWVWTYADNKWSFQQKITAQNGLTNNNRQAGDSFGRAISLSGETLAIGAPFYDGPNASAATATNGGAVFIFTRNNSVWSLQQKIIPTATNQWNADDNFGAAVSLDGDTVAIGAPGHSWNEGETIQANQAGAGFIYRRSGSTWSLERKITPSATNAWMAGDNFGYSVSLKNNLVVWGSPFQDYDSGGRNPQSNAGSAFVYRRVAQTWVYEDKVMALNTARAAGDNLSKTMAADGEWLLAGAPNHDYDYASRTFITDSGAAYIFRWSGTAWNYFQKISPPTTSRYDNDQFGAAVSLNGTQLAVSAPFTDYDELEQDVQSNAGAVWIWEYDDVNNVWAPGPKIAPSGTNSRNPNDQFGASLEINGDALIVGAPGHAYDEFGLNPVTGAGAAWIFEKSNGNWSQTRKVTAFGLNARQVNDAFGTSVSIENDLAAASSPNHQYDTDGLNPLTNAGAVWFFKKDTTWLDHCKLETPGNDRISNEQFGSKVFVGGEWAGVSLQGAARDMNGMNAVNNAGVIHLFNRTSSLLEKPRSVTLNGTSDYIKLDSINDDISAQDFTFSTWARFANPNGKNILFSSSTATTNNAFGVLFTGQRQEFIVPEGVTSITIQMWGGAGGAGIDPQNRLNSYAGPGGYTNVTFPVTAGDILGFEIGQGGKKAPIGGFGDAGYPDGGKGGFGNNGYYGGGGGGSTRLYINNVLAAMAGGGGGGMFNGQGAGGGATGGAVPGGASGATQSAPGTGGQVNGASMKGADSYTADADYAGGGGGGGYFGGGSGSTSARTYRGGSGGSGYIGGFAFTSATTTMGNQLTGVPAVTAGAPAGTGVAGITGSSSPGADGGDGYALVTLGTATGSIYTNEFSLQVGVDGKVTLHGVDANGTSIEVATNAAPSAADGIWHHFALVYTKATKTFAIYQDKNLIYSGNPGFAFTQVGTSNLLRVGTEYNLGGQLYNLASVDLFDMSMWKRALNATEVAQAYNSLSSNAAPTYQVGNWIVDSDKPVWVTIGNLGNLTAGQTVSIQMQSTDPNNLTRTYSIVSGATNGLSMSSSGLLSGAITGTSGSYSFVARVTNSNGKYSDQTFNYSISASDIHWSNVYLLMNGEA